MSILFLFDNYLTDSSNSSLLILIWQSLFSISYPYPTYIKYNIASLVPILFALTCYVLERFVFLLTNANLYYKVPENLPSCIYFNSQTLPRLTDNKYSLFISNEYNFL